MLDKISIISSKIKRNCLSLVIASVIISIIFGKSIAREVEFLLVIDMLIFFLILFCLFIDSMIDIINNIRSYDSIISWFKHLLITRYPFPASMIMNISILIKTLIKSNYAFERFVGIIFAILMIQVCMVFIYVIVSGLIIPLGKLLIILFRGDTL